MVKFALKVKAELSNVTDLAPYDEPQDPFEFTFKIQCTNCREERDKPVTINTFEQHDMSGSRGVASFVYKCRMCLSEHAASIAKTNNVITPEENGKWVELLTIDSRGIEFMEFLPQGRFKCRGEVAFDDVDLEENEWYDYDDEAGNEVSITDVEWDIGRV